MDGTLENSKNKNVSTCSIGSVATTDNNSVASDGGMSVSWEGTGALEASGVTGALEALGATGALEASGVPGTRAMGNIGLRGGLFHHLYTAPAPPTTNRATPTSIEETAVI